MIKTDPTLKPSGDDVFSFRASNVTGTRAKQLAVGRNRLVEDVTNSIVDLMELPDDVTWSLRSDRGQFLDEGVAIADQIAPGEHVTVTPRTHLG